MSTFKRFDEFVAEGASSRMGSGQFHQPVTWTFPGDKASVDAAMRTEGRMLKDGVDVRVTTKDNEVLLTVRSSEVFKQFEEKYGLTVGK